MSLNYFMPNASNGLSSGKSLNEVFGLLGNFIFSNSFIPHGIFVFFDVQEADDIYWFGPVPRVGWVGSGNFIEIQEGNVHSQNLHTHTSCEIYSEYLNEDGLLVPQIFSPVFGEFFGFGGSGPNDRPQYYTLWTGRDNPDVTAAVINQQFKGMIFLFGNNEGDLVSYLITGSSAVAAPATNSLAVVLGVPVVAPSDPTNGENLNLFERRDITTVVAIPFGNTNALAECKAELLRILG